MYITQMDLIKQRLSAEHSPSNEEIIADLIRRDASSSAKRDHGGRDAVLSGRP